jgi:hypothetical protein
MLSWDEKAQDLICALSPRLAVVSALAASEPSWDIRITLGCV